VFKAQAQAMSKNTGTSENRHKRTQAFDAGEHRLRHKRTQAQAQANIDLYSNLL